VRKSKRSEREREIGSLREWTRERERERCRRRGRSPEPTSPEEPIVDGSPPVNPSEAIFGETNGDFRWVFGWSVGEDGWAGSRREKTSGRRKEIDKKKKKKVGKRKNNKIRVKK